MSKLNDSNRLQTFSDVTAPELLAFVEALAPRAVDELQYGVIRLDPQGKVIFFSRAEANQSGFGDRDALGREFFTELAPCMGTAEFMRRVEAAQSAGKLDISFEQVGDFDDAERELRVRMISASAGGLWVFIERLAS
jgi:photoactive yellow protein